MYTIRASFCNVGVMPVKCKVILTNYKEQHKTNEAGP